MTDYLTQVVGEKYHLEKKLGEGGMGGVYLARHTIIGKKVAVKILHAEFATNDNLIHRFYREAQAAAEIGHKNIIDVMDVGVTHANEPYIVMEYLEGESLDSLLQRIGPLDLGAACGIIEPVLQALSAAHAKGIVHRDLKPENIFMVSEESGMPTVKLIDFGISKFLDPGEGSQKTQTGTILGTPSYMAPEQARGSIEEIDQRADIYAIGVILFEMLTGKLPFGGRNYNELIVNILTQPLPDPIELNPKFPAEAQAHIEKAMARAREDRYQTTEEFLAALTTTNPYNDRLASMSVLGTSIQSDGFATGDLSGGQDTTGGSLGASNVLASMAKSPSQTATEWPDTQTGQRKKSRLMPLMVGAALVVLIGGGLVAWQLMGQGQPAVAVPVDVATTLPQTVGGIGVDGVEIKLAGVPEGAKVLFDGMEVSGSTFRVPFKNTIARLEVRAEGFESYLKSVVPNKDQEISVVLKTAPTVFAPAVAEPTPKRKKTSRSKKRRSSRKASTSVTATENAASPAVKISKDNDMRKGARNTKFTDDFE